MGRYSDAQTTISILRGDKKFPKALQGELETIQTHLLLRQRKYEAALEPLGLAIELTKPRLSRARYTFIQGQLYSRTGRVQEAIAAFEKVLDLKPDFEMAFFTQITMANLLRITN
jgi:tetratricopeptide (TPR) repeat protein